MLEILQFYVSSVWVWLGLTFALWLICAVLLFLVAMLTTIATAKPDSRKERFGSGIK